MLHVAVGANDDHGASENAFELSIDERDAIVGTEGRLEGRSGLNVLDAFGAAKATLSEREVGRHAEHDGHP